MLFVFTGLLSYVVQKQTKDSFLQQENTKTNLLSQIDKWLQQNNAVENSNLDNKNYQLLSEYLSSISQIQQWSLLDENNHILAKKDSDVVKNEKTNQQKTIHTIYFKSSQKELLFLTLSFFSKSPSIFSFWSVLLALGLITIVIMVAYPCFLLVSRQESYAKYLLKDDHFSKPLSPKNFSNSTSHALSQLLLNNQLLLKDRRELTEQIRKFSYVDEKSRLGNQLFFKAEFEVRLHNKEEAESGLFILLSFVQPEEKKLSDSIDFLQVANLLNNYIVDIPSAIVARLRNNDFGLLLPNLTREDTDALCRKLIKQLAKSCFDKKQLRENFISIGISAYKQGFDYYMVMAEADMALRNAQLQGDNSWFMYGEALSKSKVQGHLKWRIFLQRVLDKRSVQLYGQSIHYFSENEFEHIEIFSRIENGNEIITADTFLPMANQCGLSSKFDRQVIEDVIKRCLYSETDISHKVFSVNLLINSLLEDDFIEWLERKLLNHPEISQHLYIEIKEKDANRHIKYLIPICKQLNKLGINWCIESVGAPHEDISYLDLLPIKQVKIDRRFINNIHADQSQQVLLNTLLINLQSRNIVVIADGVEKEVDAVYLEKSGVDGAQGYYFSKPSKLK